MRAKHREIRQDIVNVLKPGNLSQSEAHIINPLLGMLTEPLDREETMTTQDTQVFGVREGSLKQLPTLLPATYNCDSLSPAFQW